MVSSQVKVIADKMTKSTVLNISSLIKADIKPKKRSYLSFPAKGVDSNSTAVIQCVPANSCFSRTQTNK